MAPPADARLRLEAVRLTALYGRRAVVKDVSILFPAHTVTAVIGPSGCGKSTFLRCLNRMHELSEGGWVTGTVLLDGDDIYADAVDPVQLRRRVGMVFQRPTPFPTMSIYDNVAAGLRVNGRRPRGALDAAVERDLQQAALWDEVKDRLRASAIALSGGQPQRCGLARARAPAPAALPVIDVRGYSFWYGAAQALFDLTFTVPRRAVTALIGPSGCGKSTFLRSINRLNELIPHTRHAGDILLEGVSVFSRGTDAVALRQVVGMVFQQPNPFPKSIFDNVAYGPRIKIG